ncbi:unnamed protein product [Lactuca saligna]|uniref:At1g61320/AtMIF1 LRR domain-containing protein n=1 Tax=Lactuca saligna TaxID=75948 RepID=A0AA36A174_LACSI|nr:unnamed protein product [Lactuca saligna]
MKMRIDEANIVTVGNIGRTGGSWLLFQLFLFRVEQYFSSPTHFLLFHVTPQLLPLRAVVLFVIPLTDILHQECDFSCIRVLLVWVRILIVWGVEEVCVCVLLVGKAKTISMAANHGGCRIFNATSHHLRWLYMHVGRRGLKSKDFINPMPEEDGNSCGIGSFFVKHSLSSSNRSIDVIESYNEPVIQHFRIRFDLYAGNAEVIDKELQFEVIKIRDPCFNYDFPLRLSDRNIEHLCKLPSSTVAVVELISRKKLVSKSVNVSNAILEELLVNSPQLERLCIHRSLYLMHVEIGGKALNLKHLEITNCCEVESIYLYDFNLISFIYNGQAIDLGLTDLPKLKELDIGRGLAGLKTKVFGKISTSFSYIQALSFKIGRPKQSLILASIPELPNVKNLRLTIGTHEDDSLLEVASLANSCPSLEAFLIKLLWISPINRRRDVRGGATRPHEHLKLVEIHGYYGRGSDLELVAYFIDNAVVRKEILIDPRCQAQKGTPTSMMFSNMNEKVAR